VNSGNDNLPPSLPPAKGNTPKPNPTSDARRKARRAKQSGQKGERQEPELPEIKPQPKPTPPTSPPLRPTPDSFAQQSTPAEPARPLPKRPYPLGIFTTLLSLLILGLLGIGVFLLVSPDGRSIKLYTEPTPERLDLLKKSSRSIPAVLAVKLFASGSEDQQTFRYGHSQ
jgi:hypothetical protein